MYRWTYPHFRLCEVSLCAATYHRERKRDGRRAAKDGTGHGTLICDAPPLRANLERFDFRMENVSLRLVSRAG
jgi:hypothetical protein